MNDGNKEKLRRGQALAMQWVGFALQRMIIDVRAGGNITKQLMGDTKSVDGKDGLDTLELGCNYVVAFVLPLAIELALKALLIKEGRDHGHTHNLSELYQKFSEDMKKKLQDEFINQQKIGGSQESRSLEQLLAAHKADFVGWRYLDQAEELEKDDNEMQIAICAILSIYDSND